MTGNANAKIHTVILPRRVTSLVSEQAHSNSTMLTVHLAVLLGRILFLRMPMPDERNHRSGNAMLGDTNELPSEYQLIGSAEDRQINDLLSGKIVKGLKQEAFRRSPAAFQVEETLS